ncbi:hypothetical protein C0992_003655, partial [Termitomyces sp. T32_za158]
RSQRVKNLGRYEKSLEQEKLNEWGQPETASARSYGRPQRQRKKLCTDEDEDKDDDDFSSASFESTSDEPSDGNIPNDEV